MAKVTALATLLLAALVAATTMPASVSGSRLLEGSAAELEGAVVVPPTAAAGAPLSLMWYINELRDLDGGAMSKEVAGAGAGGDLP
ncbi:hypothetical protein E2562_012956 [Oryza meyeriana var. granulata]|uniref:Dirigent protein n=1 Tax=Oryza meyeriana var. granulata TaxID=110450 RepID=A0A6G1DHT3_9ORYZ|nr:hypothetical protein E2562_012956 [Oryza meyeriana var. granulata]